MSKRHLLRLAWLRLRQIVVLATYLALSHQRKRA